MRILKFSPRNKQALTYLLIIHEKLKDFKKAKEITSCLKELNKNVTKDETYLDALIILNDPIFSYEKRTELLHNIYKKDKSIQRLFVQFLLQFNKEYFWNNVQEFEAKSLIDLI